MGRSWIATIVVLVAACTPMQWVRSDVTPEQASADEELCRQAAWREASFVGVEYGLFDPWMNRDVYGRPLFYPPAGPFFDPLLNRDWDESRLANFCMRSKGYELVPVAR